MDQIIFGFHIPEILLVSLKVYVSLSKARIFRFKLAKSKVTFLIHSTGKHSLCFSLFKIAVRLAILSQHCCRCLPKINCECNSVFVHDWMKLIWLSTVIAKLILPVISVQSKVMTVCMQRMLFCTELKPGTRESK